MRRLAALGVLAALLLAGSARADGIYDTCYPLSDAALLGCIDRLNTIEEQAPNIGRILNYGASEGTWQRRQLYAQAAAANGQRLIWPISRAWPCHGPGSPNVADRIDSYRQLGATWGYYIGEEGNATACATTIASHDPSHPTLYVDGARDSSRIQAGDIARFRSFAADRLGIECYPIKDQGMFDPAKCGEEVAKVRAAIPGATVWAVGQSFSWSDACSPSCGSGSLSGPYPTRADQCAIRASMQPLSAYTMWFDYYLMSGPAGNTAHAPPDALTRLSSVIGDPACG